MPADEIQFILSRLPEEHDIAMVSTCMRNFRH